MLARSDADAMRILERDMLELRRREQSNRLAMYYRDEDFTDHNGIIFPARSKYPRHMDFFRRGADVFARMFQGANGVGKCTTAPTLIETTSGPVSVGDLWARGKPFEVWAWDGSKLVKAQATAPFKKPGVHHCYRLQAASGAFVEAADHHRFLCGDGWRRLVEFLPLFGHDRPASSSGIDLPAHAEGGQHWWERLQDWCGDYFEGFRLGGERLLLVEGSGLAWLPLRADARQPLLTEWRSGDLAFGYTSSRLQGNDRLSTADYLGRYCSRGQRTSTRDASYSALQHFDANQGHLQSFAGTCFDPTGAQSHHGANVDISASSHPLLVAGDEIVSCSYIGPQEVYDFTVEKHHNYITAGLVSHNTELALYEICCHLRGWYPEWWEGVRFNRPVDWWSCGQTSQTVRDIQQTKLLGKPYNEGTGILPADWLDKDSITRSGVPGAIDTFRVKRAAGGFSYLGFKSYNQGVAPFFGPEKDGIHLDEPPPLDIYSECVVRTRNRPNARIMVTASPKGTNMGTIRLFKETEDKSRILIKCGWAHVPHLTEQWKADTRANTAPYLLPATEHGEEGRGAGAVYALLESEFVIEPIKIPAHWRWMWAMDGGYHNTAAGWFAWDPDQDVMYLVSEYKDGGDGTNVGFHAARFIARNKALKFPEMPGVADAAAINQSDGKSMISQYRDYGLKLKLPKKAVILGVDKVRNRLQEGRLKVFSTCEQWLDEFRNYSYEIPENEMEPKIVKVNDHLMDMTRYAVMDVESTAEQIKKASNPFKAVNYG